MTKKLLLVSLSVLPILLVFQFLPYLPLEVPMHYDFFGNATRFGSKNELYMIASMMSLVGFAFSLIVFFKEKNTLNKEFQFESFTLIMSMVLMNVYLAVLLIKIYLGDALRLNMTYVVAVLLLAFVVVLILKRLSK